MKKKNRQILYLFYGLIRTHSSWLMKYWAIVEPLGCYYKGHQQPGSKSFGGSFSASLPTAWGALETIYKEEFLSFMSSLEEETTLTGAFDNYQKVIPKKDITAFKSAITHVGTSHFLKMNKPIPYPIDTVIRSPAGVHFRVTHCDYDDSGKYIVKGIVSWVEQGPGESENLAIPSEQQLIADGFMLPKTGWTVVWMPGFQPRPSLEYHNQVVPPPRRAWIKKGTTDVQVAFGQDRMLCEPLASNSESLSSERMHRIHCLARRILDFRTHANYLSKQSTDTGLNPIQNKFVSATKLASKEMDRCSKFEADLVQHINPNVDKVDKMFAFPLSPHCETSHEGMLKVYAELGQSYRMFNIEDTSTPTGAVGRCSLTPTTKKRKINLCVDALSAKMFRALLLNLTKKLTELGSHQYVEPLLDALEQFTVQHDYLHEHRMHRQDVIWRQFYGCVLQAFQAEMRYLRINGDCVKSGLQAHEGFLKVVNTALKRHRFNRFIAYCSEQDFVCGEDESVESMLVRMDQCFVEYCSQWDDSEDEPSRLCNNLLKMLEAYFRCVHSVKKQNAWMCEVENIRWHGAYKVCGKNNYVVEGLHRIDTLYGEGMSDFDLENFRGNRFFKMTPEGNGTSHDEINKMENSWMKKCLLSPTFQINVDRSKYIMPLMKCGYEAYGRTKSRSRKASQDMNIEKLMSLFERTDIFPSDVSVKRDFDDNFFWREVSLPKAEGSSKDKAKETVALTPGMTGLFNVLCVPEDVRNDYEHFEDSVERDDENLSVVSSVAGNEPRGINLDEESDSDEDREGDVSNTDTDSKVKLSLKRVGNVQRKNRSKILFSDLLGVDGDDALTGIKAVHLKSKERVKKRIEHVKIMNRYFEHKLQRRMESLRTATNNSIQKTYTKRQCTWKIEYNAIMKADKQQS
eukprot:scaffold81936_cov56-Cyclotella_meneghiniana.AAC.3